MCRRVDEPVILHESLQLKKLASEDGLQACKLSFSDTAILICRCKNAEAQTETLMKQVNHYLGYFETLALW